MRRIAEAVACTMVLAMTGSRIAYAGTITSVAAGPGLTGGGTNGDVTLSADFGGEGSSAQVSHSDHNHSGQVWIAQDQDGLFIQTRCTAADSSCAKSAIIGQSFPTTGTGIGVKGFTNAPLGYGILGDNRAQTGAGIGIFGKSDAPDATGVFGQAGDSGGGAGKPVGVWGNVNALLGTGVLGTHNALSGAGYGVWGQSSSPSGFGVSGYNRATTGNAIAVDGESFSSGGYGGYFRTERAAQACVCASTGRHPPQYISSSNGAYLSSGGAWTNASDVNLKDHFSPLERQRAAASARRYRFRNGLQGRG